MSYLESALRRLWRLVPARDRFRKTKLYVGLRSAYYRLRWRGVGHDQIFDREYFEFVERTTGVSADAIAESILTDFQPQSVIDVGCGTGTVIERLQARGVRVRGFERATAALEFCHSRKLDVSPFNIIEDSPRESDQSDVALCMEVAHQLPAAAADKLVDLLCGLAPRIVFSSETPGGGDRCSWNERPQEYWITKFRERGYAYDEGRTIAWREAWQAKQTCPGFAKI